MNLKMLLGMACLSPLLVMSEERPILSRGETIALAGPEGYEHYQWQVSADCQSFIDIPGATQKDLKMSVSTWFNAQDGKGWQYMSTLRLPNNNRYFDSWYSFLENYNWSTGQAVRQGFYRNGYGRAKDQKKWYHFNMVDFGHTDGGNNPGNRNDYGQGVSETEAGAFPHHIINPVIVFV